MRRLCLLIVVLAVTGVRVSAYVLVGHAWVTTAPVPFYVNPANVSNLSQAAIVNALTSAANAWNAAGTPLRLQYAGTSTSTAMINDGRNNIFFRNDTNGSFIAETYWWFDGSQHLVDFDIAYHEAFVRMFPDATTCSGGISILETGIHELGHAIGLAHSDVADAIMYAGGVGYCDPRTALAADDMAGLRAMYGGGGSVPAALARLRVCAGQGCVR